jgi:hypothetical protein
MKNQERTAALGIDGNCGYALLGPNIQEGEAEFVEIAYVPSVSKKNCEVSAINQALYRLRKRLGRQIGYHFTDTDPRFQA